MELNRRRKINRESIKFGNNITRQWERKTVMKLGEQLAPAGTYWTSFDTGRLRLENGREREMNGGGSPGGTRGQGWKV